MDGWSEWHGQFGDTEDNYLERCEFDLLLPLSENDKAEDLEFVGQMIAQRLLYWWD